MRRHLHSLETPPFRAGASMLYYENRSKDEHVWRTTRTWGSERWDFGHKSSIYKLAKELVCETFLRVAQADTSVWYLKDLSRPLLTKPPHTAFYGMHKTISTGLEVSQYIFFFFLKKGRPAAVHPFRECVWVVRVAHAVSPCVTRAVTPPTPTSLPPSWALSTGVGLVEALEALEAKHLLGLNNRMCIN